MSCELHEPPAADAACTKEASQARISMRTATGFCSEGCACCSSREAGEPLEEPLRVPISMHRDTGQRLRYCECCEGEGCECCDSRETPEAAEHAEPTAPSQRPLRTGESCEVCELPTAEPTRRKMGSGSSDEAGCATVGAKEFRRNDAPQRRAELELATLGDGHNTEPFSLAGRSCIDAAPRVWVDIGCRARSREQLRGHSTRLDKHSLGSRCADAGRLLAVPRHLCSASCEERVRSQSGMLPIDAARASAAPRNAATLRCCSSTPVRKAAVLPGRRRAFPTLTGRRCWARC
eukprot:NODE_4961_length_1826_cov_4.082990.p2 GENE.NODE_4961_length_1826_cov_4.082990~~NODE_4961_length_1826_cov_4.082990.p2  ORF type:complete len:292 (-),score=19.54 NODE_4961_length_1826_cov_4.082990:404-1279(-)